MRGLFIIVVLVILIAFENFVLEKLPEKEEENRYTDLTKLPPSSALPHYLGSLFLGAFRAAAVDLLWLNYIDLKGQKRFLEAREIIELLSYLQSRNEEVWTHLAWDLAYNVAGGAETKDEEWKWIRYGFLRQKDAINIMNTSPYQKWEMAWMLYQKATWEIGRFQEDYLSRFLIDKELQIKLSEKTIPKQGFLTPFEIAIGWLEKAKIDLAQHKKKKGSDYYRAPMGLYIHNKVVDNSIRECYLYQIMFWWLREKNIDETIKWLKKAISHVEDMASIYQRRLFDEKYVGFFNELKEIIPVFEKGINSLDIKEQIKSLGYLENLLLKYETLDSFYIYDFVSKRKKAMGGDIYEFNDGPIFASPIREGQSISANIAPSSDDKDYFSLYIPAPEKKDETFVPKSVKLEIIVKDGLMVSIEIEDPKKDIIFAKPLEKDKMEVVFSAKIPGVYIIKVEALKKEAISGSYSINLLEIK
jgi:hypothetical protein